MKFYKSDEDQQRVHLELPESVDYNESSLIGAELKEYRIQQFKHVLETLKLQFYHKFPLLMGIITLTFLIQGMLIWSVWNEVIHIISIEPAVLPSNMLSEIQFFYLHNVYSNSKSKLTYSTYY